jgi:transposase InsO family protein
LAAVGQWPGIRAKALRGWLGRIGAKTLYIEPGSPWENGYIESFNGKLRDELLRPYGASAPGNRLCG